MNDFCTRGITKYAWLGYNYRHMGIYMPFWYAASIISKIGEKVPLLAEVLVIEYGLY